MDVLETFDLSTLTRFKINILAAWLGTCALSLVFAVVLSVYLFQTHFMKPVQISYQLYQALPENNSQNSDLIRARDGRALIIENFFQGHHSVLAGKSDLFVQTADENNLDWRLLPSIAMQESGGGRIVPSGSFNPFGFGVYGGKVLHFDSWDDAIQTVGRSLREDYLDQGLLTPEQIMTKYTPPSLEKGGAWAKGINSFIEELQ